MNKLSNNEILDLLKSLETDETTGLNSNKAEENIKKYGYNEIPIYKPSNIKIFLKKFWNLSAWMLELVALVSLVLKQYSDFIIAILLVFINAILSFFEEKKASSALNELQNKLEVNARVLRDNNWIEILAKNIVKGDIIRLRKGDFVCADCIILGKNIKIDQSSITGESENIEKERGTIIYSGSVVSDGETTAVVTGTGVNTFFGKTAGLVQLAAPKLHIEGVIQYVVKWLFLIISILVIISMTVALMKGENFVEILPICLILLMSAIPIGLPVMFTASTSLGSLELSKEGVLVTRLNAVEDAANMDVFCTDKTGTLTLNRLSYVGYFALQSLEEKELILYASRASNESNADPIDRAILTEAKSLKLDTEEGFVDFIPFDASTRYTVGEYKINGEKVKYFKGALKVIADLCKLEKDELDKIEANSKEGMRELAIAKSEGNNLKFLGIIYLKDPLREDSKFFVKELNNLGISVKMLTGDSLAVAKSVGEELNLKNIMPASKLTSEDAANKIEKASGFAEIYPEDKFNVVKLLQSKGHIVGMTGDGVNDAPALKQAEVGVAVSNSSDIAKSSAGAILTSDGLAGVLNMVKVGRKTYQKVLTWVLIKVGSSITRAGFVTFAYLLTGKFIISAIAMLLLVLIGDLVVVTLSTDKVQTPKIPLTWKIMPLIAVAGFIGIIMLCEILFLLYCKWDSISIKQGELYTFSFLSCLFFSIFTTFSFRERRHFFASLPSKPLFCALILEGIIGVLIGLFGFASLKAIELKTIIFIISYCAIAILGINDFIKTHFMTKALIKMYGTDIRQNQNKII